MNIKVPQKVAPGVVGKPGSAADVAQLAGALLSLGIAKTPAEARKMAAALLAALTKLAPQASGLSEMLKHVQASAGLPTTGVLDDKTASHLTDSGALPRAPETAAKDARATPSTVPSRFERIDRAAKNWGGGGEKLSGPPSTPTSLTTTTNPNESAIGRGIAGAKERMALSRPKTDQDLKNLQQHLSDAGFRGRGQGAEALRGQVRAAQKALGLPVTGRLDDKTLKKLSQMALNDGGGGRTVGRRDPSSTTTTNAPPPASTTSSNDAHRVRDGETRPTDAQRADGAHHNGAGSDGASSTDMPPTSADVSSSIAEGDDGNAPAGDDDVENEARGHATSSDDSDDDAGHYEIPSLHSQIVDALEKIERDDDGQGPPSYAWDVTFHRPGIYGAYQPAEPLWHIGIAKVSPFDPIWSEAARVLGERLTELEPDEKPPSADDFERALRRARARSR